MPKLLATLIIVCMMAISYHANAATVHYTFDNIVQDDGRQMTGLFKWDYNEGFFEAGTATLLEVNIPGYGTNVDLLAYTIDTTSVEITYNSEVHNINVGIHLKFDPFTSTSGTPLYLTGADASKWEDVINKGFYDSGAISLTTIPIPAAIWLFGTGLIALLGFTRRKSV